MIKISDTEYFSNDKTIRFLNMDCNEFMAGCKENEFDFDAFLELCQTYNFLSFTDNPKNYRDWKDLFEGRYSK